MDIINQFLNDIVLSDSSKEEIMIKRDDVVRLNSRFASLNIGRRYLRPVLPFKENQIWTVKPDYLDYEGRMQRANHIMMVLIVSAPEEIDTNVTFVRACPISPFIEHATKTDQVCDDPSIIGFSFLVETWNEQPLLTEILDKYVTDFCLESSNSNNEVLSEEEDQFREIEISNARYLNNSIIAYMNEIERADNFSFSVDLQYANRSKTQCMPIQNVQNPRLITLSEHEEYAQAARMNNCLTENDYVEFSDSELPFIIKVRKKADEYILSIIPRVEVKLLKDGHELNGTSNTERIVFDGLKKGIYEIKSELIDNKITIRLK